MKGDKVVKIIGLAAAALGLVASVATNWVNEKNLDSKIDSKVTKALAEATKTESN